jgi:hypothetical protein
VHRCFSVDPTARVTDVARGPSLYKNCFLFHLTRPFPTIGLGVEMKIAKCINLGGISMTRSDGVEMVLEDTLASFAAKLLNFSGTKDWVICGGACESHPSCRFINQIWKLMNLAPWMLYSVEYSPPLRECRF